MIQEVKVLLDHYSAWLKDRTSLREVGDSIEITTPYLDRHNDYLQIYAKRANGGFVLTDDGYVLDDLALSGCNIDSPKRQTMFRTTLNGFGVKPNGKALEVKATLENFSLRKHNLVQAMLAVNDLFYLASQNSDENRALTETRDLLLPKLMSGEIRLQDAEKVIEAVA